MLCLQYFSFVNSWNLVLLFGGIILFLLSIWVFMSDFAEVGIVPFCAGIIMICLAFMFAHSDAWKNEVRKQLHRDSEVSQILSVQTEPTTLHFLDKGNHVCKGKIYNEGPANHKYYFLNHSTVKCHREVVIPNG